MHRVSEDVLSKGKELPWPEEEPMTEQELEEMAMPDSEDGIVETLLEATGLQISKLSNGVIGMEDLPNVVQKQIKTSSNYAEEW